MGDTGSLTIGGIIAVISIAVRKEWLIPLICGIFLIENLSYRNSARGWYWSDSQKHVNKITSLLKRSLIIWLRI